MIAMSDEMSARLKERMDTINSVHCLHIRNGNLHMKIVKHSLILMVLCLAIPSWHAMIPMLIFMNTGIIFLMLPSSKRWPWSKAVEYPS